MKKKTDFRYILIVITGCGMIGVTLGVIGNAAGQFFLPIANEFGVGRGTVAFTTTIYSLAQAVSGLYAPHYIRHTGLKKTALAGFILLISTTCALSLCNSVLPMIILNIIRGLTAGFVGTVTVNVMLNYWFHKNSSLTTSIAMAFSGVVGAVLSPLLASFIAAHGWRAGYLLTAGAMVILLLPSLVFPVSLRPQDLGLQPYGYEKPAEGQKSTGTAAAAAVPTAMFIMMLIYSVTAPSATSLPQHFTGISDSYGLGQIGAMMVSVALITNTCGKLFLGVLISKLGSRRAISLYAAITVASVILLIIGRTVPLLLLAAAMVGIAYSMGTVATSSMVRDLFGPENYSKVYPKLFFGITMSNSMFTTLVGTIYDMTGSYLIILIIITALSVIALTLINVLYSRKTA